MVPILFFSCISTKSLRFTQKTDDVLSTESLKDFLEENKNPKVVLRVTEPSMDVTEGENIDYLYNAIENQLLASGFIVRDRQLFNQIIQNNDNNIDYQKLKVRSDTDLIIELTKIDSRIIYETNKYYDKNNKVKVSKDFTYQQYGASVEFKVVMINSNEFSGIYKFNYTPCVDGCIISKSIVQLHHERRKKEREKAKAYEGVEKDELEEFMKDATQRLVHEMRS